MQLAALDAVITLILGALGEYGNKKYTP